MLLGNKVMLLLGRKNGFFVISYQQNEEVINIFGRMMTGNDDFLAYLTYICKII